MNFNIHTFYKFHCICILPLTKINKLPELKKTTLDIILISEGSLTRSIEYLTSNTVYIQKSEKENYKLSFQKQKMRSVWMGTCIYSQLTFARSLWMTIDKKRSGFTSKLPIGKSFIKHRLDIHKTIHELYYGYGQLMNIPHMYKQPIWGRKYTLYYKDKYYITIQEFFSPEIINGLIT
uniref:Chorismate lyase n=1 Tax=Chondria sp. (in: red algae) TaxID=1982705 RepID=A0A1Z1MCK6_9FLOR|nr:hypothetical protein [Chondria sp. (in: red algae)]